MSDDTLTKLGTVRRKDEGRDAIHIAVVTMQANQSFRPVRVIGVTALGILCEPDDPHAIGIVDPFLPPTKEVNTGDWFFVFLKPASITGLRHVWSHPAFPDVVAANKPAPTKATPPPERPSDESVIRTFCEEQGISIESFVDVLTTGQSDSEHLYLRDTYILSDGRTMNGEIPSEVLDAVVRFVAPMPVLARPSFFSCAC